jgi:hypothetical protein
MHQVGEVMICFFDFNKNEIRVSLASSAAELADFPTGGAGTRRIPWCGSRRDAA